jgi:hypothetical protein
MRVIPRRSISPHEAVFCGNREGHNAVEAERFEPEMERGLCRFPGQTLALPRLGQPPADFDGGREGQVAVDGQQAAEADEDAACAILKCPTTPSRAGRNAGLSGRSWRPSPRG